MQQDEMAIKAVFTELRRAGNRFAEEIAFGIDGRQRTLFDLAGEIVAWALDLEKATRKALHYPEPKTENERGD